MTTTFLSGSIGKNGETNTVETNNFLRKTNNFLQETNNFLRETIFFGKQTISGYKFMS